MRDLMKLVGAALLGASAGAATAQDAPEPKAPPALNLPLAGPLTANPAPTRFDLGFGDIYVTGAASGIGYVQGNVVPGDVESRVDVANAHLMIQKAEGPVQFFAQVGLYSFPVVGVPYLKSSTVTDNSFGALPQAFIKLAPSDNFSVQAGLLPTLIGAEYAFTFQNQNVQRGLLWNQENIVNRGVQLNFSADKLLLQVAVSDGFFSGKVNWLSALATYTIDSSNILAVAAGGALSKNYKNSFATPVLLNNSQIYNIIYTYTNGPVMLQPYVQYTKVNALPLLGTPSAETWGAALLARYTVNESFSLPVRVEYIDSSGSLARGTPNLLYGPGSNAFSLTVTPTFTAGRLFARLEGSVVSAGDRSAGFAFGPAGNDRSQVRGLIEVGAIF